MLNVFSYKIFSGGVAGELLVTGAEGAATEEARAGDGHRAGVECGGGVTREGMRAVERVKYLCGGGLGDGQRDAGPGYLIPDIAELGDIAGDGDLRAVQPAHRGIVRLVGGEFHPAYAQGFIFVIREFRDDRVGGDEALREADRGVELQDLGRAGRVNADGNLRAVGGLVDDDVLDEVHGERELERAAGKIRVFIHGAFDGQGEIADTELAIHADADDAGELGIDVRLRFTRFHDDARA